MKAVVIRVYGKVQGVFFRQSAAKHADSLGVRGFAQNAEDGSVYIEAESEEAVLKIFLEWCHKGPVLARVDRVEMKESVPQGFSDFKIKE